MPEKVLHIDIETRSDIDLSKAGVYPYSESDNFAILLVAAAIDDGEIECFDLASGDTLPEWFTEALTDPSYIKVAHNASFERVCFSRLLNGRRSYTFLDPSQWHCTMVHAAMLGLPFSLDGVAKVLGTGEQKDKAGTDLIKYFCVPCKPTESNGHRTWNNPSDAPEKWSSFKDYCLQDVATERDIYHRLQRFPIPDTEKLVYTLDQQINDRGVLIDLQMVEQAIKCDLLHSEILTRRAYELTSLENPNSVSQLKMWLEERGLSMDTLGKKQVAAQIKNLDKNGCDAELLEMLKLRLQMAKSSVKKYQAAERAVSADGRARGLFKDYGASHTGRWASRSIQLQNCPANHLSTLDEARELLKLGTFDMLETLYGNTPDTLSQLIRTMLIPKAGCEFVVADFSAIEARVLAWLACEQWRLDSFNAGADIYCASASQMFGVPVEKHGVNGHLRQKGKVAELACIAEDQLVLTNTGLVPIQNVTKTMLLWDGTTWVHHNGVIDKGFREVIEYEGLIATEDHLVWVEGQPNPVYFGFAAASGAHIVQTGDGRQAIRLGENHQPGKTVECHTEPLLCPHPMYELWGYPMDSARKSHSWSIKRLSELFAAGKRCSRVVPQTDDRGQESLYESEPSRICELRGKGNSIQILICAGGLPLDDEESRSSEGHGNRPNRHKRQLCLQQYAMGAAQRESSQSKDNRDSILPSGRMALCQKRGNTKACGRIYQRRDYCRCGNCGVRETEKLAHYLGKARLYDIRDAGPRNRYTVSGKLVHNCGYGGAAGALIAMGALDMGLKESELPDLISDWRNANPRIVQYWWDVDKAATDTVKTGNLNTVGLITFERYAGELFITLPSGRKLAYASPRLEPNRFGRMGITYMSIGTNNKWQRLETYGPKIVENVVQATARDLLAEAMLRVRDAGYDIILHCHDEMCVEVPKGTLTVDDLCKLMSVNPSWAEGLPLSAAGYRCPYYQKD